MQALRLAAPAFALAAVLSSVFLVLGFATAVRTPDGAPPPPSGDLESFAGEPEGKTLSAAVPREDVRGEPIRDLPRHPGSVRVAYSENRADGLSVVRARYVAEESPGAVRDFYAGVFGPGSWEMANVEYAGGEWYLLAVRGGREAVVEAAPRGERTVVRVEVSRPTGQGDGTSAGGSKR